MTSNFMSCLAEEREHSTLLDLIDAQGQVLTHRGKPSRRPRSPSSNHNVKERQPRANFHSALDGTPPARQGPRNGVGAGYMRAISPSQTPKSKYFQGLWIVKGLAI